MGSPLIAVPTDNLREARFLQRINRFIAKIELADTQEILHVHIPSTGRLDTVLQPGQLCYLKKSDNPQRKTLYSLYHVQAPHSVEADKDTLVCVDSLVANRFVKQLLIRGAVAGIPASNIRAEVSFGKDRLDFVVDDPTGNPAVEHLIEVKSVNMAIDGIASFPDAPTERGQKHVRSLIAKQSMSHYQTHIIFVVQRNDAFAFQPCHDRDPVFSQLLAEAKQAGTMIHACLTDVSANQVAFAKWLPIKF